MGYKVGILSMQRIQNYGSFLQAYGLKRILEDLGCDVQFVDYHPGETLIPADGGTGIIRKISKVADVLKQGGPLKEKMRFIQYKKNYAANYFPYLDITEEKNYTPEVDVLIVGSDEVFNCVQNNTNVGFSPELFGQGNKAKKLISYAASFGNTTMNKLEQYGVKEQVAGWLRKFDAISVRDRNSGNIVKSLIGKEPLYNLDPVLVFNYLEKCKKIPSSVPDKDYVLLYGYSGRFTKSECRQIRQYANNEKWKIYCIGGIQNCCDKFISTNPFEVIAYFQHANCVITDTFHGTIMSIITHQRFVVFVRKEGYGNSQKILDLLKRFNVEDRIISKIDSLPRLMNKPINYDAIDEIIRTERKKTYEYLEKWVK